MKDALIFFILFCFFLFVNAGNLTFKVNESVGAIDSIKIDGDTRNMNWVLQENQEKWITKTDLWGLGRISTRDVFGYNKSFTWQTPIKQKSGKDYQESVYQAGDITISVSRKAIDGNILEEYTFTNNSYAPINITDLSINTPFNDNYTETPESTLNERCHAHIWAEGGNSAYVCALNIGANAPHVGLVRGRTNLQNETFPNLCIQCTGQQIEVGLLRGRANTKNQTFPISKAGQT